MATLWIREYPELPQQYLRMPAASEPGLVDQALTYTTTAASNAFGANTRYVRLISDANFHFVFGASPTATTGAAKLTANAVEYFSVQPGHKVAAVTGT